jgi:hypothetical protein
LQQRGRFAGVHRRVVEVELGHADKFSNKPGRGAGYEFTFSAYKLQCLGRITFRIRAKKVSHMIKPNRCKNKFVRPG